MELFTWHVWTQNVLLCYSQGLHKAPCFMSLDKALWDKYSLCCCCCRTTALWSPTLPPLTRPGSDGDDTSLPHTTHPSSMTSIACYTTGRTESVARHPHTYPPTGAAHTSHSLLTRSRCIQKTAHYSGEIFPGFLLPDVYLTLSERGEMSRSPVKGSVEISYNLSKWKQAVWLALSGRWAGGRNTTNRELINWFIFKVLHE